VVFKSDTVPHEVRPTSEKRVAIVGWFNRRLSDEESRAKEGELFGDVGGDMSPLAAAIMQHYREKGEAVKF
jgi:hypothetical protein